MQPKIILASASPRRRQLMEQAGISFTAAVPPVDEKLLLQQDFLKTPRNICTYLAEKKAESLFNGKETIIGCDTIVCAGEMILGKPQNQRQAEKMLELLSGRWHQVYTGVAVLSPFGKEVFCEKTEVEFYPLSQQQVRSYIQCGESMDKAGAYGIQGRGALLVKQIQGDYYNVVGLPISRLSRVLEKLQG